MRILIFAFFVSIVSSNSTDVKEDIKFIDVFLDVPKDRNFSIPNQNSSSNRGSRVFGGYQATDGQLPWVALVEIVDFTDEVITCTGSLIATNFILTAQYCFANIFRTQYVKASLGSASRESGFRTVEYSNRVIYPYNNGIPGYNELAIVQLDSHVTLSAYVKTIRLPSFSQIFNHFEGAVFRAAGYGSNYLHWADYKVLNRSSCYINDYTLCSEPIQSSTEVGDFGGSAVIYENGTPTLIGVNVGWLRQNIIGTAYFIEMISKAAGIPVRPYKCTYYA